MGGGPYSRGELQLSFSFSGIYKQTRFRTSAAFGDKLEMVHLKKKFEK